ncbi:MAG: MBL fold metallo-hydrolase [Fretibacterium sp.]|nr:MBL fold metallo-hydrolase [Fretibacterium sp.]
MKLRFLGGAGEVTGSLYHVECGGLNFFVDYGTRQGRDEEREKTDLSSSVPPGELHSVFLTHAHIDHSGRVPYLVKMGFKGKVWATPPTADLVEVLWYDSARLMKEEAEWKSRKNLRRGLPPVTPLYDEADVENALKLLAPVPWETPTTVAEGVEVTFVDAGHILGSSSVILNLTEQGEETVRIVFSGDLGQQEAVMDRAPSVIREAHYVLIESTYGDRLHKDLEATRSEFRGVILKALKDRGKVLIPSFVVDRAQRILFELSLMQLEGLLPEIPIFFDSPMGVRATEFYQSYWDTLSSGVQDFLNRGLDPFQPKNIEFVVSPEDSRKINSQPFGIVIAGSGMCNGGRIIHHLKHGAWNPKNHIVFVGYQAYGTLGRRIVDGETELRIAGEDVVVRAKVHTIGGFSAHADSDDLLTWAGNYTTSPLFFVVHGEPKASRALADSLQALGMRSIVPAKGQEFSLSAATALKTEPHIVPISVDEKALAIMDELAGVLLELRREMEAGKQSETLMPMLLSMRVLLDAARKH